MKGGTNAMKLILAIIRNEDSVETISALMHAGFFVTKLSTTGGFLMVGNTTLLIGIEEARVDDALDTLRLHCSKREHENLGKLNYGEGFDAGDGEQVTVGGATVFILNVDRFEKL